MLSHRAYLGDIIFFVGSLLQRRKQHSDFVGLTSPLGGKGLYFSFLTLRPGLLLCSDLSFFCNHGIQQHTHTHTLHCPDAGSRGLDDDSGLPPGASGASRYDSPFPLCEKAWGAPEEG